MKKDNFIGKGFLVFFFMFLAVSVGASLFPVLLPAVISVNVLLLGSTFLYAVWASKKLAPGSVPTAAASPAAPAPPLPTAQPVPIAAPRSQENSAPNAASP